jgi:hypothetical protein
MIELVLCANVSESFALSHEATRQARPNKIIAAFAASFSRSSFPNQHR